MKILELTDQLSDLEANELTSNIYSIPQSSLSKTKSFMSLTSLGKSSSHESYFRETTPQNSLSDDDEFNWKDTFVKKYNWDPNCNSTQLWESYYYRLQLATRIPLIHHGDIISFIWFTYEDLAIVIDQLKRCSLPNHFVVFANSNRIPIITVDINSESPVIYYHWNCKNIAKSIDRILLFSNKNYPNLKITDKFIGLITEKFISDKSLTPIYGIAEKDNIEFFCFDDDKEIENIKRTEDEKKIIENIRLLWNLSVPVELDLNCKSNSDIMVFNLNPVPKFNDPVKSFYFECWDKRRVSEEKLAKIIMEKLEEIYHLYKS